VGRLEGFNTRLRELDAGPLTIASGDYHYEGGFAAACELYGGTSRPQALGQVKYWTSRLLGRRTQIIEYKTASAAS